MPARREADASDSFQIVRAMLIGILSDIHANREALDAVLGAIGGLPIDRLVLLGDLVGYGPDPAYVVNWAQQACADGAVCIKGNHDEAAATGNFSGMSENARDSLRWTVGRLSAQQRDFLAALPMSHRHDDIVYTHAGAWQPAAWPYVKDISDARQTFEAARARIAICGHTHVPVIFYRRPNSAISSFVPVANKPAPLFSSCRSVIVVGAVGQPRDGNPAACAGLLDTDAMTVTMLRVPYDWDGTARKIADAGLPSWLGRRLKIGR